MNSKKQIFLLAVCAIAILGAGLSIYFTQFRRPAVHEALHIGIGNAMATETARVLGGKGKILAIIMESQKTPELKVQIDEFERTLKNLGGFKITKKELETEGKAKYTTGAGLSGRRFLRALKNHADADAFVSFVGAPNLTDEELAQLDSTKLPKFIAEVRTPEKLKKLFDKHIIQAAIVSRFQFPSPGPRKPRTPEEWFQNRFQIITAENAALLPESGGQ
jgi:hypothetical protein